MAADWALADALIGGTRAMRAARQALLPKWPNEDKDAYECRLATAVLFPAYARTVSTLAGKPFSKPVTVGEDVPSKLVEWLADCDQQGRDIHTFASDVMECAVGKGLCGILVDYPQSEGVRTLADEQSLGLRPYLVHIQPEQLLGWRAERNASGWGLAQLRFMESVQEPSGEFATVDVQQVRVLEPGLWATYRQNEKKDWVLFGDGVTSLASIPFVPVYGQRTAFMEAKPPLIEVAHLNVAHWQSASDQQTILHVARVPLLFTKMLGDTVGPDGKPVQITVGANTGLNGNAPESDAKFVEHSGAAIGAGREDLQDLEERMRQAGAELLVLSPGKVTATQVNTENAIGMCALQRMVLGLEDALDQSLQLMADWVGEAEGGHVTLFNDFGALNMTDASSQIVMSLASAGQISNETAFHEQQRRGVISADVTWEDEQERIEAQGPALGAMTGEGSGGADGQ